MSTTTTAPVVLLGDELAFPSDFLSWADLKGKPRVVTIESLQIEQLERKGKRKSNEKPKLVATLVGKKKKWVINRTNAERIAQVLGTQALKWIGRPVAIQPDTCTFGRETVSCIRANVELTRAANNPPTGRLPLAPAQQPLLQPQTTRVPDAIEPPPATLPDEPGEDWDENDEAALAAAAAASEAGS